MTEYPNPPNPGTTVNLGNEGLSEGEAIDSYLENYWNSGTHVQIPGGTYSLSSGSSLNISASSDAWLEGVDEGNGAQVTLTGGSQNCSITANGCNVRVENITMSGSVDSDRIRPSATTSGSTLTFIRFERPDGVSSDGDDAEGMFVPNTHAGELWLVDCWIEGFADNGLYASVPGNSDGAGGSTHVRGGLYRNNNVANIRLGGPGDSCKGAVSVHDGRAPVHSNGGHLQRGVWIREHGTDILFEDVDIYYSYTGSSDYQPFVVDPRDSGGSGQIIDSRVYNDTSYNAITIDSAAGTWSGSGTHLTGSGNLTNMTGGTECSGSGCDVATNQRRWWTTSDQDSSGGGVEEGTGSPTPEIRYGGQRRPLQEIKVRHDGGLRGVRRVTVRQNGEPVELWSAPRPPTDGRVSHYDASLLNDYADGDSVSSWEDAVGGLTATQSDSGSMPIFDADGINANPALRFDGGHWLEVGLYDQMLSQPYTIVVVAQYDSVGERNHYAFYGADTDERALLDLNRTGAEEFMFWAGTSGGLTQPNDENTHVFTCVADGAASVFRVDDTEVTGDAGTQGQKGLTIGADSSGGRGMSGWIGELLVYDRSLSQSERDDLAAYLSKKWGI
jgi:hypothetical protein